MWQRLPDTGGLKSMNKIEDAFKNKKAFIPFVTAALPSAQVRLQRAAVLLPLLQQQVRP